MSGERVTVRVDFYPTGDILPLGITNAEGNSQFIDKVVRVEKLTKNKEIKYYCLSNDAPIVLVYRMGIWYKEKNES